jgi:predicted secreted protein
MVACSKLIAVCALLAGSGAFLAHAQTAASRETVQNLAQLSANAAVEVQQDLLSIAMTTTLTGPDANAVQTQLKQALDAALAQARLGASPGLQDVRTGQFSLYPRYGKDGKINGWQGSAELLLEGRDFARITASAGKIQTLTVGNVSFSLSREQRARTEAEAQAQAIERFKSRAREISSSFGFAGYALREVSVSANDQSYAPRPRAMAMQAKADMADSAVPVEAGKSTVLVTVSGTIQMR